MLNKLIFVLFTKLDITDLFQEKKSIRPTFSAERIYGGTLLAMCSNDFICFYDWADCRLIRRIDVSVKVSNTDTKLIMLVKVLLFSYSMQERFILLFLVLTFPEPLLG